MMKGKLVALFVACLLFAGPVAQALQVGDIVSINHTYDWVKKPPTHYMDGSHITVIELWATWCGPCYSVIPLLTSLQSEYADSVHMVGVSREGADLVVPYVEEQGDRMDYSVACEGEFIWQYYNDGYYSHAVIIDQSMRMIWRGSSFDIAEPLAAAVEGGVFIRDNPVGCVLTEGEALNLSVSLTAAPPVSYAWTRDGQPVGGNSPTLSLSGVSQADAGEYFCTVTRTDTPAVSVKSVGARVRVMPDGELPVASHLGLATLAMILLAGGARTLKRNRHIVRS